MKMLPPNRYLNNYYHPIIVIFLYYSYLLFRCPHCPRYVLAMSSLCPLYVLASLLVFFLFLLLFCNDCVCQRLITAPNVAF